MISKSKKSKGLRKYSSHRGRSIEDRFFEKIIPEPTSGCWLWDGACTTKHGYGHISGGPGARRILAHRLSFEMVNGKIAEGLVIDHLCRNPYCVNPDHLEAVTIATNNARGISSERRKSQALSETHCRNGHPYDGCSIRADGYKQCLECRREKRKQLAEMSGKTFKARPHVRKAKLTFRPGSAAPVARDGLKRE